MTLTYQKENRYDREVYCFTCKEYSIRGDNDPKCSTCGSNLIRVCYDGEGNRLTGIERKDDHYTR